MFISNQMFILIVALALAFVVSAGGLLVAMFYYMWRLKDSHRTLYRIIQENLLLHAGQEQPNTKQPTINIDKHDDRF